MTFNQENYRVIIEHQQEQYERKFFKILQNSSDEELLPCPFCGGDVELRDEGNGGNETYAIHCNKCHMHFEKFVWRGYGRNTVIKEWNTRVKE